MTGDQLWYIAIFGGQYFVALFLLFLVLYRVFGLGERVKRPMLCVALATVVAGLLLNLLFYLFPSGMGELVEIFALFSIPVSAVFVCLFIKENKLSAIAAALNYIMMCTTIHYLVGYANIALWQNPPGWVVAIINIPFTWLYSILSTLVCLSLHALVAWFLIQCPIKVQFPRTGYMVFILVEPVVYCGLLFLLKKNMSGLPTTFAPVLLMSCLLVTLATYFINTRLMKEHQERVSSQLLNRQMQLQLQHVNDIQDSYQQLRKLRHDMHNHMLYMELLLEEGKYDKLRRYFEKTNEQYMVGENAVNSDNQLVNAVLGAKLSTAAAKNITVNTYTAVPEKLAIEDYHLCALMLNLLDNAIEAAQELPDARIDIDMRMQKSYLSIEIANTAPYDVLQKNPSLLTTKPNREEHGMGVQIVKEIVNRYNGILSFKTEGGMFVVSILLSNENAMVLPA